MKIRVLLPVGLAALISFGALAEAYDAQLAQSYAKLFAPVAGAQAGKALHLMTPQQFIDRLRQEDASMVTLDVRTPNEFGIFGMTLPGSMQIAANEVFLAKNLARIPQDKTLVTVCATGVRATAVATALRHIGFTKVYVLKGGYLALSKYLTPKTANPPPPVSAP
jgi:rhodanese-related sulfurtransferase